MQAEETFIWLISYFYGNSWEFFPKSDDRNWLMCSMGTFSYNEAFSLQLIICYKTANARAIIALYGDLHLILS